MGDLMKYFIIFYRCIFFYTLITIIYRIMGKREIGELSIMDFIVSIFITDMVVMSIENYNESICTKKEFKHFKENYLYFL